uniref:Uncharacterized protein n=1 Tax=Steinernema glaseri TaxID=37863 RepID=A0A1I7XYZ8_9BILA
MFVSTVLRFRKWISSKFRRLFWKEKPKIEDFPLNRLLCLASRMAMRGKILHCDMKTVRLLQVAEAIDWSGTTGQGPPKRIRFIPTLAPIPE